MAYRLGGIADQVQRVTRLKDTSSDALIEAHEGPKNGARESTATVNGGYDGRWYHSMTDCVIPPADLLNDVLEPEQKMARWTNFLKLGSVDIVACRQAALYGKRLLHDEKIKVITPDGHTAQVTWMNELLRRVAESWYAKLTCNRRVYSAL
jgi:hypothetical protein